jgi:competence protein ComEA
MRKYSLFILLALMMCLAGCAHASDRIELMDVEAETESSSDNSLDEMTSEAPLVETKEEEPGSIVVYVCGAVLDPGVYELLETSRINDAVEAAGGFSEEADTTYVNLAAPLSDGIKLKIPTLEETKESADKEVALGGDIRELPESFDKESPSEEAGQTGSGLININSASADELKTLPGIGDKVAGRIVEYRDKNGKFEKIEDIMKISGIKDKLFSKIKDKITV